MAGRTRKIISAVMAALMIMAAGGCGSSNKEIPSSADNSRYISETKDNGNVTDGKNMISITAVCPIMKKLYITSFLTSIIRWK